MYKTHLNAFEYRNRELPRWRAFVPFPAKRLLQRTAVSEVLARRVLGDPAYFKFAVVRHPWNRLVSGFRDKYIAQCRLSRVCLSETFVPALNAMPEDERVSLTELLLALLHTPANKIDKHFLPSSRTCDIGRTPYDFIGDVERAEDIDYILGRIKSPHKLERDPRTSDPDYIALVASIGPTTCDRKTVDLAAEMYRDDLAAYGYTMDAAYESCERYGTTHPPK
jgi:hypothetical protein